MNAAPQLDATDTVTAITDAIGNLLYLMRTDIDNPAALIGYLDCAEERIAALNRWIGAMPPVSVVPRCPAS